MFSTINFMKSKLKNRLQEYHHQKEREMIYGVEIPDIGYTNSIGFVEIFQNRQVLFLHLNPYRCQTLLF